MNKFFVLGVMSGIVSAVCCYKLFHKKASEEKPVKKKKAVKEAPAQGVSSSEPVVVSYEETPVDISVTEHDYTVMINAESYDTGAINSDIPEDTLNRESVQSKELVEEATTSPYIISPEEFQSLYESYLTLHLFRDGVVTDEDYHVLTSDEIASTIGMSIYKDKANGYTFEGYEDCFYVRNDITQVDYEILLDERSYRLDCVR